MKLMKQALLGTIAIVLSIPAIANASPVQDAQRAAISYWGNNPCGGHITIQYATPSRLLQLAGGSTIIPLPQGYQISGYTDFDTPSGPNDYQSSPSTFTNCVINFNKQQDGTAASQLTNWNVFCPLMVHEYGHLEGYPDTTTDAPTSIKYQNISPLNEDIPACGEISAIRALRMLRKTFRRFSCRLVWRDIIKI